MNKQGVIHPSDLNTELKLKGFKAYDTNSNDGGHTYSRKDFYKISLTTGKFIFHYADKSLETDETFLFFANPNIPYSCEVVSPTHNGYTCLFSEDFLKSSDRSESLLQSPLFKIGGTPIFKISKQQKASIVPIFQKMIAEQDTTYAFKDDLIRNYINLIIHEALKMQPSEDYSHRKNAAARLTSVFLELLERQFPIESIQRPLQIKTAQDFAKQLSVHVNYLNSSVKEVTGKPTTTHIAERIINEARALLQHTDWNINAEVAPFGIHTTVVNPGFFRTELLTEQSTTYADNPIEDYNERRTQQMQFWKGANGQQSGDPSKLGQALVRIADEEQPPLRFLAGADAVDTAEQVAATLQRQTNAYRELSSSMAIDHDN